MSDPVQTPPPSLDRQRSRWPLIVGALLGGFLLVGAGLGLGWYLFYRPIVNVAVQLPAPPAPPAPPGPDAQAVKALEDQIAALKDRLRADVCTAKDPAGKDSGGKGAPQQSPMSTPSEGRKI
jgi:hypothetical protein